MPPRDGESGPGGGALDWARLVRLPNHATAVADVLAGWLVVTASRDVAVPPGLALAVAAGWAYYAAGMVLNDVCDVELDALERPERPLPSGRIGVARAALVGRALLALGGGCACAAAVVTGHAVVALVGALLAAAIWIYDRHAKATPFGPAVMGACRALNWLVGMTAAGGPRLAPHWLIPAGIGLYVAGITLYARDEAATSRRAMLVRGAMTMAAGILLVGTGTVLAARETGGLPWGGLPGAGAGRLAPWTLLLAMVGSSVLFRALLGIADPSPPRVRAAVGNAIMSLITIDAVLVLAACGEPWAVVVLALLAPFVLLRRVIPPT
ncbi:MAG: UbiA family prenyltransferase [Planctomycetaceae bacterium]